MKTITVFVSVTSFPEHRINVHEQKRIFYKVPIKTILYIIDAIF